MQISIDSRDVPATIQREPQERRSSRGRQVPDGVVGHAPRFEEISERIDRVSTTNATASSADASRVGERTTSRYGDSLSTFMSLRPRLFGIVYRMLRSAAEAEDVVQDVWMRWQTADHSQVRDAEAFLVTTATRLAINVMQSARSRRETYVGPWLPEPVDTSADPGLGAERGEALEVGVQVLLEKLTPTERGAYILREAFDYPYREIANVLRLEEANARQVVTRARRHVANGRRMSASSTEQRLLLDAFTAAAQTGDVGALEGTLNVACRRVSVHRHTNAFDLTPTHASAFDAMG